MPRTALPRPVYKRVPPIKPPRIKEQPEPPVPEGGYGLITTSTHFAYIAKVNDLYRCQDLSYTTNMNSPNVKVYQGNPFNLLSKLLKYETVTSFDYVRVLCPPVMVNPPRAKPKVRSIRMPALIAPDATPVTPVTTVAAVVIPVPSALVPTAKKQVTSKAAAQDKPKLRKKA